MHSEAKGLSYTGFEEKERNYHEIFTKFLNIQKVEVYHNPSKKEMIEVLNELKKKGDNY